jgi:hypothetical protein
MQNRCLREVFCADLVLWQGSHAGKFFCTTGSFEHEFAWRRADEGASKAHAKDGFGRQRAWKEAARRARKAEFRSMET